MPDAAKSRCRYVYDTMHIVMPDTGRLCVSGTGVELVREEEVKEFEARLARESVHVVRQTAPVRVIFSLSSFGMQHHVNWYEELAAIDKAERAGEGRGLVWINSFVCTTISCMHDKRQSKVRIVDPS
jgi:hypothetical protein